MFLIQLYIFILGLILGSFYNVCIYRIESGEPISKGRSHCQTCQHQLAWYDLIPLFSWLFLKGKCRYCSEKISARYPLVESLTGILFLFCFHIFGFTYDFLISLVIISSLIITAFIDLDTMYIRDRFIILLGICGLALILLHPETLINRLLGAAIISIPLFIVAIITQGIGYGDVKLMAVAGLILGWQNIILAMIVGSILGSIPALYQMIVKKKSGKSEMPLGPYLCMGIAIALFYGQSMITWYIQLL